jgi:Regulator of ribonuclease activity B
MYLDEQSQMERLEAAFAEMRDGSWKPEADLLWGYFFVDSSRARLENLSQHLDGLGYHFVEIFEMEDENGEPSGARMLHVERIEVHSPATLAKRNVELSKLASEFGVEDYDGWDVGKPE